VFEADLVYVFRINARFAIENRRLEAAVLRLPRNQKCCRTICADRISHHRVHRVVDEIAGGANLHRQQQRRPLRVGAYEVASALQRWRRTRATQADDHRAMDIAAKPHVSDQATSKIRAHVAGGRA
jgi:hypothetical protein